MADTPIKPISEIEVKEEVSENDKILILDSETEEARLASKEELRWPQWETWPQGEQWPVWPTWPRWPQWEKGDKGDKWDQWIQGIQWPIWLTWPRWPRWEQGIQWPTWATWPKWATWDKGDKGDKWDKGDTWATGAKWDTWAKWEKGDKWDTWASITEADFVWNDIVFTKDDENTVVLENAKTELKWDKWDKGDKWDKWDKGDQWPAWPWSWDVLWPSSAVDWDIALFDWVTGKLLKDWNKKISDFATSTQWEKADTALQPDDNISELTNDSWFQTQQQVNSAISQATANFITKSVSDLTNYYLKSETYTQTEVNNLIWAIQQFHYEIYPNLQSVTSPASNVLYLIWPKWSGSDLYEEYVYTTQFIKIWETSIDLSNYVTISALNTALARYVTSSELSTILNDYVTSTDLSTTLQDYVTSSSLATTLNDYATTSAMNQALAGKASASDLSTLEDTVSDLSTEVDWKIDYPSWWSVGQALKKTADWAEWWTISWWHNYAWETKTISNSELEIWLRTIVDNPWSNFTLTAPATLEDWMEYVLRCINTKSYTITLWTGFTNPRWVDLSLSYYATDQFVFVAVWWNLELQPLFNN